MTKKVTKKTPKSVDKALTSMETKSAKIRFLSSEGWSRSEIAAKLNLRYQHVRNVLVTPLKRS